MCVNGFFSYLSCKKGTQRTSIRIVVVSYGLGFKMMMKPSIRIVVISYGLGFKMMM